MVYSIQVACIQMIISPCDQNNKKIETTYPICFPILVQPHDIYAAFLLSPNSPLSLPPNQQTPRPLLKRLNHDICHFGRGSLTQRRIRRIRKLHFNR